MQFNKYTHTLTHTHTHTIVNPCAGSNLGNAARHVGKHLADAVERKKNKYRGSFPATYSLLPLAMSTCGDVGSDVPALIKELAIRRVQHRSETYSNDSQHLAEETEVARLRRRFFFVLQQALSFRTRHHLCRQGVALASTRRPHAQGPASVQAHRTGGVTESEGQEGANGVGGGIGVWGGNGAIEDLEESVLSCRSREAAATARVSLLREVVSVGNPAGQDAAPSYSRGRDEISHKEPGTPRWNPPSRISPPAP